MKCTTFEMELTPIPLLVLQWKLVDDFAPSLGVSSLSGDGLSYSRTQLGKREAAALNEGK